VDKKKKIQAEATYFTSREFTIEKVFLLLETDAKEALKLFFEIYKTGGNDKAKATFGIALSMYKLNFVEKAIYFLREAVALEPKNTKFNYHLGLYLKVIGKHKEAINYLKKSILLNNSLTQAYLNLGLCSLEIKDFGSAIEAFKKTIELDPANLEHLKNLSQAFISAKQWESAKNILIKITSEFLICRLKLAEVYSEMNMHDKANLELNKIVNFATEKKHELDIKSVALIRLNRYPEAYDLISNIDRFSVVPINEQKLFPSSDLLHSNYDKLPKISINTKELSNLKNFIIYSSADVNFANTYIAEFAKSLHSTNPNLIVHFHLMGEKNESIHTFINDHKNIFLNNQVSMSYEITPYRDGALYISRRLCRAIQFLKHFKLPILQVDMDCLFLKDLTLVLDQKKLSHVALFERPSEISVNQLILAAFCYFSYTNKALNFLRFATNYLCHLEFEKKNVKWFCDQVALLSAKNWFQEQYPENCLTNLNDTGCYIKKDGCIFDAIKHQSQRFSIL